MSRAKGARPSPAIVVAVLALVAALAGTAIAGPGAETSKLNKAKVKNIAKKQINKTLPIDSGELADGAVTTAKIADGAVTAEKLATTASPRVFMHFDVNGVFQPGESRGVTSVNFPANNVACLDLEITARTGGATRGLAAGGLPITPPQVAVPAPGGFGCPGSHSDAVVQLAGDTEIQDVWAWFD
jgi:hypothetical protein